MQWGARDVFRFWHNRVWLINGKAQRYRTMSSFPNLQLKHWPALFSHFVHKTPFKCLSQMVRISPSPTPHRSLTTSAIATLWGFGFDPLGSLIFEFQLFYSLFKSLHGKEMLIELKNDLRIRCCAITQRYDSSLSSFSKQSTFFAHLCLVQG